MSYSKIYEAAKAQNVYKLWEALETVSIDRWKPGLLYFSACSCFAAENNRVAVEFLKSNGAHPFYEAVGAGYANNLPYIKELHSQRNVHIEYGLITGAALAGNKDLIEELLSCAQDYETCKKAVIAYGTLGGMYYSAITLMQEYPELKKPIVMGFGIRGNHKQIEECIQQGCLDYVATGVAAGGWFEYARALLARGADPEQVALGASLYGNKAFIEELDTADRKTYMFYGAMMSGQKVPTNDLIKRCVNKKDLMEAAGNFYHIHIPDTIKQLQYFSFHSFAHIPKIITLFREKDGLQIHESTEKRAIAINKAMEHKGFSWPEAFIYTDKTCEGARFLMMLLVLNQKSCFIENVPMIPLEIWEQIFNCCTPFQFGYCWKNIGINEVFNYIKIKPENRIGSGFFQKVSSQESFIALQEGRKYRNKLAYHDTNIPKRLLYPSLPFKLLYKTLKKPLKFFINKPSCNEKWQIEALCGNINYFLYESRHQDITLFRDKLGANLLHYAAWSGNFEAFVMVYKYFGKHLPQNTLDDLNAVDYAILSDNIDILNFLLEHEPELFDQRDKSGFPKVFYAAAFGKIRSLQWIRETMPDKLREKASDEKSIAHTAACFGNKESILWIKKYLVDLLDCLDNNGYLPSHHAALRGNIKNFNVIIKALLPTRHARVYEQNIFPLDKALISNFELIKISNLPRCMQPYLERNRRILAARLPFIIFMTAVLQHQFLACSFDICREIFWQMIVCDNETINKTINVKTIFDEVMGYLNPVERKFFRMRYIVEQEHERLLKKTEVISDASHERKLSKLGFFSKTLKHFQLLPSERNQLAIYQEKFLHGWTTQEVAVDGYQSHISDALDKAFIEAIGAPCNFN